MFQLNEEQSNELRSKIGWFLTRVEYILSNPEQAVNSMSHRITEQDVILLRRVIQTGVVTDVRFRLPNGLATLDRFIQLKERQDVEIAESENRELTLIEHAVRASFKKRIEGGLSLKQATDEIKAMFAVICTDDRMKGVFNRAYQSVKKEIENGQ